MATCTKWIKVKQLFGYGIYETRKSLQRGLKKLERCKLKKNAFRSREEKLKSFKSQEKLRRVWTEEPGKVLIRNGEITCDDIRELNLAKVKLEEHRSFQEKSKLLNMQ